jgi:hypothetical protein
MLKHMPPIKLREISGEFKLITFAMLLNDTAIRRYSPAGALY